MAKSARRKTAATISMQPVLSEFGFLRNDPLDEDFEPGRTAGGVLTLLPSVGDLHAAMCRYSAGQGPGSDGLVDQDELDEQFFEVNATYLISFSADTAVPEEERRSKLLETATSSAWPLFRTLFAQVTTQATMDLPALPLKPDLDWEDDVDGGALLPLKV